ncbi:MAG: chemotaxis response regulator protein-glutamate methylesterase [Chromatiaceae bacterium]|nr:chemotaxis response regulator protein-glutamate methylesterase [Gammaproteobacteria bacterium]MCP5414640.1 chemotaxis response regulator protein-glutamate methylesterase [Chromatiaceae bacterium]MCP5421993.1 chemotaxis response regulator protein-glutamate methylesterase [Chromatiaceae bacterium]
MAKIRVLVVDDSALVRQVLTQIFAESKDIEVVGVASDPYVAREKIKQLNPDVLTLDVEMPRMDGVTFLGNLMRLRPMPVVMVSTLTEKGAEVTLRALEYGAVDFVSKPKLDVAEGLKEYAQEITEKVRIAAKSRVRAIERAPALAKTGTDVRQKLSADAVLRPTSGKLHFRTTDRIIGIGSSTGGTEAIKDVLAALPMDIQAGIVISQHIPAAFSGPFAKRVDSITALSVCEARDGQQILPGHVYIAPGDRHLVVERDGARYVCRLNDGPPVNRHKPSVDVMIRSLAQNAGPNAIGVMLTGMGDDGAAGMGELKQVGAPILVQDEKTSVVWGMPGEVAKRGFADEVLPLGKIAQRLQELVASN